MAEEKDVLNEQEIFKKDDPNITIETICSDSVPTVLVDGFKGASQTHNIIRVNFFERRLDPESQVAAYHVVTRLAIPINVFQAMTDVFNQMVASQKANNP